MFLLAGGLQGGGGIRLMITGPRAFRGEPLLLWLVLLTERDQFRCLQHNHMETFKNLKPRYPLEVFGMSRLVLVKKLVVRGCAGATLDLALRTAGAAGPSWAGRLGGQVTGHKLVVLLVGPYGQGDLVLEAGVQV